MTLALPSLAQTAPGEALAAVAGAAETAAVSVDVPEAVAALLTGALPEVVVPPPHPATSNAPAARQSASPRMVFIVRWESRLRKVTVSSFWGISQAVLLH